uniref:Uncharacterized protein ycf35 n=1 Tax=Campylaephora sungminbooi TaxID=1896769 RepID=A0A1B0RRE0_9FLOR|nr:hypothetical protein BI106_gp191 [Campylaephora sungminbooi]AKU47336.1 hypothetical protein [Campylaephora sungminbooi]ALN11783.1 conserved hypothetical plastid protein [Campylaephora sungminbooi]
MSHFSKIKTSINNINLLKKTLIDLGFECNEEIRFIKDTNGSLHKVNLIAKYNTEALIGFYWQNNHYNVLVDLDLWKKCSSFHFFIEQLNQNYALNTILQQAEVEGFQKIKQYNLSDGSVKLTVQRWV